MERRRDARVPVEADVTLHNVSRYVTGFAENLSVRGIFVATHLVPPVGSMVEITIHLSGGVVCGVGEVRWQRRARHYSNVPPGMGLRFVALEPGSPELLRQIVQSLLER